MAKTNTTSVINKCINRKTQIEVWGMEQHRSSSDAMLSSVCLYVIWSTNFYVSASNFYVSASDLFIFYHDIEGFCDNMTPYHRNNSACLSATYHETKRKITSHFLPFIPPIFVYTYIPTRYVHCLSQITKYSKSSTTKILFSSSMISDH